MDLIKAEISRKRKLNDEIHKSINSNSSATGNPKYLRQSDIIKAREEKLREEQNRLNKEREIKQLELARKLEPSESKIVSSSVEKTSNESKVKNSSDNTESQLDPSILIQIESLSIAQVKSKLRSVGMPITLFGEDESDRRKR